MRKLDLKARAQKRTSSATARPETLAKKRRGSSEGETVAINKCCGVSRLSETEIEALPTTQL